MPYNILFLFADQFAYHAMGHLTPGIETPALDHLAEEGTEFLSCYTNAPLCLPARASLATGRYPRVLSCEDNRAQGLRPGSRTWMGEMQKLGYESTLFGKAHLQKFVPDLTVRVGETRSLGYDIADEIPGPRTYGILRSSYYDFLKERGLLERYCADMDRRYRTGPVYDIAPTSLPTMAYGDVYVANQALDYLRQVPADRPWLCTVGFGGPHDPWDTPAAYQELYRYFAPPPPLGGTHSVSPDRPRGVLDELLCGKYDPCLTEDILSMTPAEVAALRRSYYGHVTLIDDQIRRILDCLEERRMLENTIVVFSADHGEQNGDHGLLFKQTFYEPSIRVPLIIRHPEKARGQKFHQVVELMDLGPALLELAGGPDRFGWAESLWGLTEGRHREKRGAVAQVFGETMLLLDNKKAVFNEHGQVYLLFDLLKDPEERLNLAGAPEYALLEREMAEALRRRPGVLS